MSIEVPHTTILVPGRGLFNVDAARVDAAVREYDERLSFGFNPANEDWCVYIKLPRGFENAPYYIENEPVWIVLGFQHRIPSPDEAIKRLYETDALKHGSALLDKMNAENERLKKKQAEEFEAQMDEATERVEHALRYHGKSPITKIYFTRGVTRRPGYRVGQRRAD